MIQPTLKKKAADAIGELMNMARLHRTNGDTEAADEFAGFAEVVRELAAEVKRLDRMGASILETAKKANQLSSDTLDERNQAREEVRRQSLEIRFLKDSATNLRLAFSDAKGGFKNFHRSLCARFGCTHDEKDWWRDCVSLEEAIAKQLQESLAGQIRLTSERDQLKAENVALTCKLEVSEDTWQVIRNCLSTAEGEIDKLKAEVEALRDGLEQVQYDANAWRNGEESVWVEVFNSEGDDPFISAISGQITIEQLALIQSEMLEYREDYFEKGSGLYVFKCTHYQANHDNVGMTEPAHWESDLESYNPFPWDEEREPMAEGEQP